MNNSRSIVLAVTGASGSAYAVRLAQVLLAARLKLHLVVSEAAREVSLRELNQPFPASNASDDDWHTFLRTALVPPEAAAPVAGWGFADRQLEVIARQSDSAAEPGELHVHGLRDFSAGIASGSFRTRAMVICPCSMGTLASIANGNSGNLIHRAADVHLKERRRLILVPRETPLSAIGLANMSRLASAGATIMPAAPGFYHQPACVADLVDFLVARICDHLDIEHQLMQRWG